MPAQQSEKLEWTFDASMSPELRSARALEYQAHYLERIEGHLARIANGIGSAGPKINLVDELQAIRVHLLAPKR